MEQLVRETAINIGLLVEAFAAIIIAIASVKALFIYFKNYLISFSLSARTGKMHEELRVQLGGSVAVALELLLGADVLMTAVTPTWNDIGMLAAIAGLRTGLNYFLERELKKSLT